MVKRHNEKRGWILGNQSAAVYNKVEFSYSKATSACGSLVRIPNLDDRFTINYNIDLK